MGRERFAVATILVLAGLIAGAARSGDLSSLAGPYLGQKVPGLVAEVFAPRLVRGGVCSGFMSGGELFVFKMLSPDLDWKFEPVYVTELVDGRWSEPTMEPFEGLYPYNFTVAPDGATLYFTSVRDPADHSTLLRQSNIWRTERTSDGWSEPEFIGPPVNTDEDFENYPSVTREGTLYFMSWRDEGFGKDDVYRSRLVDGEYLPPENIGAPVNTELSEIDPFIAADESFLIFCSQKPGGFGGWDLYVSFQSDDGSWSAPANLGSAVNSEAAELRPSVTPDGKYLFFTSDRSGDGETYWVSSAVTESLRERRDSR